MKLKNQKYIDLTDDLIRKYRDRCDRVGERLKTMSVEQVVDLITSDQNERFELDIVAYTWKVIEGLKASGHSGNAASYITAIRSLVKFVMHSTKRDNKFLLLFHNNHSNQINHKF